MGLITGPTNGADVEKPLLTPTSGTGAQEGSAPPAQFAKLYVRGAISNSIGAAILLAVNHYLGLGLYIGVACGLQYGTFLLHGLPQRSEKLYDLSGSFTHLAVVVTALMSERRARSPRQAFAALASTLWLTRLGTFLYGRILRDGKDARFDHIKPTWLSFLGAWTLQAVWVTLTQLPVVLLNTVDDSASTSVASVLTMCLWLAGFLIEGAADMEKLEFRSVPENRERYITSGLWRYSRHPNYFGELLMWSSMSLLASLAAVDLGNASLHAAWLSPLVTAVLLLGVSGVPMVEAAGRKKWGNDPAYVHYISHTSRIVPWRPAPAAPQATS